MRVAHSYVASGENNPDRQVSRDRWNAYHSIEGAAVSASDYYAPTDSGYQFAINRAIDAVTDQGGGAVTIVNLGDVFDLTGKVVIKDNVDLVGIGMPCLRMADGVKETVIEGDGFLSLSGTDTGTGVDGWGVRGLVIDGNRGNNASPATNEGHGIAVFGRDFTVSEVKIRNAARKGLFTEYGSGSTGVSPFNGGVFDLLVDTVGETGWDNRVSDLHFQGVNIRSPGQSADNTYDAVYLGGLAGGVRGANLNVWRGGGASAAHRYALNIGLQGSGTTIVGAHLETAKTASILLQGPACSLLGILSYNLLGSDHLLLDSSRHEIEMIAFAGGVSGENTAANVVKVTGFRQSNIVRVRSHNLTGPMFNLVSSGGANVLHGRAVMPTGGTLWTGTPHITDVMNLGSVGATTAEQHSFTKHAVGESSIAGIGTTQSGAAAVTLSAARLFPTGGNTAFVLPVALGGEEFRLTNVGGVDASVFPASGETFRGASTDAADTLAAGSFRIYFADLAGTWVTK